MNFSQLGLGQLTIMNLSSGPCHVQDCENEDDEAVEDDPDGERGIMEDNLEI